MPAITWEMIKKTIHEKNHEYKKVEDNLDKGIGLYGSGQFGQLMLDYMKDNNYKIDCYLDSNRRRYGQKIQDIEIKSLNNFSGGTILITVMRAIDKIEIRNSIKDDYPVMAFDEWFAIKNIDKYEYIRNVVLADDESKHVLDTIVYEMLTNSDSYYSEINSPEQYFCLKEFVEGYNDCFVDVGAYTGEGVESFIWKKLGSFSKIYAFEPLSKNYNAMVKRVNRLIEEWGIEAGKIELVKAGISDIESNMEVFIEEDRIRSTTFLNNSVYSEKTEQIPIYTLDKYFADKTVTFIKADIEGFEMKMQKGAEEIIKRDKPKLAICVYHRVNDIFDFVKYLGRIVPEYKFRLRHHSYNSSETVLYCNT